MAGFFIAVGGTGQMAALAYRRLSGLVPWMKQDYANIYHMDMDVVVDFTQEIGTTAPGTQETDSSIYIDPLPAVSGNTFGEHFRDPANPQLCNDILDTLFTSREQQTSIRRGMYGRPPVGSAIIRDALNNPGQGLAHLLGILRDGNKHKVVICGSSVGGTGAGGVPTLAHHLDKQLNITGTRTNVQIYVLFFLKHFTLTEAPAGSDENEIIDNAQLDVNASSGMCYLQDKIAEGTNGCLLLGMQESPKREYQQVSSQTDHSQFLHLIAALYTQQLVVGGNNLFNATGRHSAHVVDRGLEGGKRIIKDLGIEVPVSQASQVTLDRLIQLNLGVRDMLIAMVRLMKASPKLTFIPAMPQKLRKLLKSLPEPTETSRTREQELQERLNEQGKKITKIIEWYEDFTNGGTGFDLATVANPEKVEKIKRHPMPFIRQWCKEIGKSKDITQNDDQSDEYAKLTSSLMTALYRTLDGQIFNRDFF